MATIELAPALSAIRGSIAGTSFRRHGTSQVILTKPRAAAACAESFNKRRRPLAYIANAWQSMTIAQRRAWNTYAQRCATQLAPPDARGWTTGYMAFSSFNLPLAHQGLTYVTAPPAGIHRARPFITNLIYSLYNSWVSTQFSLDNIAAGDYALMFISHTISPGAANPRTWSRAHGYLAGPRTTNYGWFYGFSLSLGQRVRYHIIRWSSSCRPSLPMVVLLACAN